MIFIIAVFVLIGVALTEAIDNEFKLTQDQK